MVSGVTAAAIALAPVSPAFAESLSRQDYDACQARDEASFRAALETVMVKTLSSATLGVDYPATIAEQWRRGGLDEVIDKRVDIAIAEVRDETSWGNLLQSLANEEKAKALATAVAERVYRSDAVKSALESLAGGVGKEIGNRLETASKDAAEPAVKCLHAFLGPRYGTAVARAVTSDAGRELGVTPGAGGAEVGAGAVISSSSQGIAGAAILVMRRQLANMAGRVSQRIVGSILSRLVSVVAGGVGLVLIAKDLWELRHGVLPIIASEMKSKETKDKVQQELATTISEQVNEHVKEIGAKAADRVVEIWQDFRRAHAKAIELAEHHDGFRKFLDGLRPAEIPRLDDVISLLLATEGEAGVLKRLADGTLQQGVAGLAPLGMDIARENRSLDDGLKWAALAGDQLPQVVDLELYKRAKPDGFSKSSLQRVLRLDDRLATIRIAALPKDARETLFDLDTAELKSLARSLTESELETLSRYLTGLDKLPRERVLRSVAQSPSRMQVLASNTVRDAIITSRDQAAAVDMMLSAAGPFDPTATLAHVRLVADGKVNPILLWEKHPLVIVAGLLAALVLLLLLRRLFAPRRPKPPAAKPTPGSAAPTGATG